MSCLQDFILFNNSVLSTIFPFLMSAPSTALASYLTAVTWLYLFKYSRILAGLFTFSMVLSFVIDMAKQYHMIQSETYQAFVISISIIQILGIFLLDLSKVPMSSYLLLLTAVLSFVGLGKLFYDSWCMKQKSFFSIPDDSEEFNHLRLGSIVAYSRDKSHLDIVQDLASGLPESYKNIEVDIRFLKQSDLPGNLIFSADTFDGISIPIINGPNKIVVPVENLDRSEIYPILLHEITHARQYNIYGRFLSLYKPSWKLEGEATLIGKNVSDVEITEFLERKEKKNPFRFNALRATVEDYKGAGAQAWYYLSYLGLSSEEFFSPEVKLAPWSDIQQAWNEKFQSSDERYMVTYSHH